MAETPTDLISMADIARLAGEKRATVGNWKSRNPEDFPRDRGRGPRGPLYDRGEVIAWLEASNRLNVRAPEIEALWSVTNSFRGELSTDEVMPLVLLLLAIKSKSPTEWDRIQGAPAGSLNDAVRTSAHQLFSFAADLLPHRDVRPHALSEAIGMLAHIEPTRVGELTDALLEQAATAMGARGGEFLTPRSVRRLVVAIAEPKGTVYNPATGVAQLLIDTAAGAHEESVQLFGQEINARIWAMAQLNLAIHDTEAQVTLGDVFGDDHFAQLRADLVVCVPPWNQKLPIAEVLLDDPRWVFGEPGPNDGNAAWIQHCLAHLVENGRAVIVLPNGALFEGGRAGRIRQRLVKAGLLEAVFALPGGLFAWTALSCSIVVFTRGRRSVDGKPAPTLMVDLTDSHDPQARTSTLTNKAIDEAALVYRRWINGTAPENDRAALATFDDLAANEFVIDPGRYLSLPPTTPNLADATRNRTELVGRLASLSRASREADDRLQEILGVPR
jgi:type I restriction-modification system DNA methylase subunit